MHPSKAFQNLGERMIRETEDFLFISQKRLKKEERERVFKLIVSNLPYLRRV